MIKPLEELETMEEKIKRLEKAILHLGEKLAQVCYEAEIAEGNFNIPPQKQYIQCHMEALKYILNNENVS